MKFKPDENLDVRLAAAMRQVGFDGDTVLIEALSGAQTKGSLKPVKKAPPVCLNPKEGVGLSGERGIGFKGFE